VYRLFRKKYAVPIGHGNSFFGHGKSFKKSGHRGISQALANIVRPRIQG